MGVNSSYSRLIHCIYFVVSLRFELIAPRVTVTWWFVYFDVEGGRGCRVDGWADQSHLAWASFYLTHHVESLETIFRSVILHCYNIKENRSSVISPLHISSSIAWCVLNRPPKTKLSTVQDSGFFWLYLTTSTLSLISQWLELSDLATFLSKISSASRVQYFWIFPITTDHYWRRQFFSCKLQYSVPTLWLCRAALRSSLKRPPISSSRRSAARTHSLCPGPPRIRFSGLHNRTVTTRNILREGNYFNL